MTILLGLLDLEDEGTMVIWNIRNCHLSTQRRVPQQHCCENIRSCNKVAYF